MGVPSLIVGGISALSGISQARAAKSAAKQMQKGIANAPSNALNSLQDYYAQFGGAPGYQQLQGGDYQALQNAIYQQQAGLLEPQYQEAQRKVYEDAAKRGFASSIVSETQQGLGREYALGLQQAAQNAVAQRYGLQAQDLANMNAFNQQNYQLGLGAFQNLAGVGVQGAASAGQGALNAVQQQGQAYSGIGSAFGGLMGMYQNQQFQNNLLSALGGTNAGATNYDPYANFGMTSGLPYNLPTASTKPWEQQNAYYTD